MITPRSLGHPTAPLAGVPRYPAGPNPTSRNVSKRRVRRPDPHRQWRHGPPDALRWQGMVPALEVSDPGISAWRPTVTVDDKGTSGSPGASKWTATGKSSIAAIPREQANPKGEWSKITRLTNSPGSISTSWPDRFQRRRLAGLAELAQG